MQPNWLQYDNFTTKYDTIGKIDYLSQICVFYQTKRLSKAFT